LVYDLPLMKHLYIPILVLVLLLTQWGSLDHDYHVHDSGESCDYCLSAHALDHAVTPTLLNIFESSFIQFQSHQLSEVVSKKSFRYYAVRAPPRFI
jgi:hypothetical protein